MAGEDQTGDRRLARRRAVRTGPVEERSSRPLDDELPSAEDVERFGDVTQTCPECGAELYDDVTMCYACGSAVGPGARRQGRVPWWVLVVVGLLVLAMVLPLVL